MTVSHPVTSSKNKYIFPFFLILFEMACYLSSDLYLPALPTVMENFGISHAEAQSTITVWFLGTISVQLILGPLADRYGRKPLLCFGAILLILSSMACAFATDITTFLIARFFQGSCICFMAVPGYASIHESFNHKEAIKILALMNSISVLAPALGPVIGSVILMLFNWRWIFGFLTLRAIISAITLIMWMPETLPPEKRHPFELTPIMRNYLRLLTNMKLVTKISVYGLLVGVMITWVTAGPFLVISDFKSTPLTFSIYQGLIFFSFICANYFVKTLIDRTEAKKIVQYGLHASLIVCTASIISSYLFPHFLFGMILIYIFYAFTAGSVLSPLDRLTAESSDDPMGARMAIASMLISGFAALTTILVSLFYNGTLLSLAIMIFALILTATIIWRYQHVD